MCMDWEFIGAEEEMENPLSCVYKQRWHRFYNFRKLLTIKCEIIRRLWLKMLLTCLSVHLNGSVNSPLLRHLLCKL